MMYCCLGALALIALCALPMADAAAAPADDAPAVVIDTTYGPITVELDRAKAPVSVDNFLKYVDKGHYAGTVFHRVIADFMIQGGGMGEDGQEKATEAPIKNEGGNGLRNARGTISMARTNRPDSATAQFYINLKDNGFLDRAQAQDGVGYAVFGKVTGGMDIVDKIGAAPTGRGDVPTKAIVIKGIKRK